MNNRSDIVALVEETIEKNRTVKTLVSDVKTLKSDVEILKSDVAVLKSDVKELKVDVYYLKADMDIVKHKLDVVAEGVSELLQTQQRNAPNVGSIDELRSQTNMMYHILKEHIRDKSIHTQFENRM